MKGWEGKVGDEEEAGEDKAGDEEVAGEGKR